MKEKVVEKIIARLKDEGVGDPLAEDTKFHTLEVDSLGLYSMLAGIEDDFDVFVDTWQFNCSETIGDLADTVIEFLDEKYQTNAKAA